MADISPSQERGEALLPVAYHHTIIEGTAYEAGRLQGEFLRQVGRAIVSYEPADPTQASRELRRLLDLHCPGLTDEIAGAADSLGLSYDRVLFCAALGPAERHCSQLAALPAVTRDGHLYVARSYEIGLTESDLRLCTTRVKGKAAHLGFSEMFLGRNDGINSYGLCVTMSGSWDPVPPDADEPHGLHYAYAIRAVLDTCKTLSEALALLQRIPIAGGVNMIVAHASGTAALVEIAGRRRAVKRIDAGTAEQWVFAANHGTMLGVTAHSDHSVTRYRTMDTWLKAHAGQIDIHALKAFLGKEYPEGVWGFSRELRMGTLWSIVFDVPAGCAAIRFGPPPHNAWHTFTLDGSTGVGEYTAMFPA